MRAARTTRLSLRPAILAFAGIVVLAAFAGSSDRASASFPAATGRIAFQSEPFGAGYDVFDTNPDGSGLRNLTNGVTYESLAPAYSPDGQKIVFYGYALGDTEYTEIYVMNSDGSGLTRLTHNDAT